MALFLTTSLLLSYLLLLLLLPLLTLLLLFSSQPTSQLTLQLTSVGPLVPEFVSPKSRQPQISVTSTMADANGNNECT